ncbi:MAG TPA: hypothetical protein VHA52_04660 [Candidatus Babeliaceae bacterium]|nr:hypothetical protein [Candidatus Babeliaceae bacterium]
MPLTAYEILNARVKQKIATEADWLAVDDELGVIFEGEQAFVWTADGVPVNFKIGDGIKKFSELPYFISYYSNIISHKVLFYSNENNITIPNIFRNLSGLHDVILINNSGADITLKVGTTDGGNDIMEIVLGTGVNTITLFHVFQSAQTVYFTGLTGLDYSLVLVYYQYDEAPVQPPAGAPGVAFRWPKFTMGMFQPFGPDGAAGLAAAFDFTTGLGMPGTAWENCCITGAAGTGTWSMGGIYPVGWKSGDTIGGTFGNPATEIIIKKENLPSLQPKIWGVEQHKPAAGGSGGRFGRWVTQDGAGHNAGDGYYLQDDLGGTSEPITIAPPTRIVLYWVAITD